MNTALNRRDLGGDQDSEYRPDVYLAKVPDNGIPERNKDTGDITPVDCDIWKVAIKDGEEEIAELKDADFKKKVYNPFPVKWFGQGNPLIEIRRNKFGLWICEKPPMILKAVPLEEAAVGADCQVNPNINNQTLPEVLIARLNWMSSDQPISAGKETIIKFFEDENRWVFINAECENQ